MNEEEAIGALMLLGSALSTTGAVVLVVVTRKLVNLVIRRLNRNV